MRVIRYDDVADFAARVRPRLLRDEAENNLPLGMLFHLEGQAAKEAVADPEAKPLFLLVESDDEDAGAGGRRAVLGVALRVPPYNVVLTRAEGPAVDALVAHVLAHHRQEVPGVTGPRETAARFAAAWGRASPGPGAALRLHMEERLYGLEAVAAVPAPPGRARVAEPHDRALLVRWMDAFADEARVERHDPAVVDRAMADRRLWVWEEGAPVTMTGFRPTSARACRIGPVYTPPAARRRGYATALVAAVSRANLDSGKRACFLFADLANPTSNAIYRRVGFRPVCDWAMYRLYPIRSPPAGW